MSFFLDSMEADIIFLVVDYAPLSDKPMPANFSSCFLITSGARSTLGRESGSDLWPHSDATSNSSSSSAFLRAVQLGSHSDSSFFTADY